MESTGTYERLAHIYIYIYIGVSRNGRELLEAFEEGSVDGRFILEEPHPEEFLHQDEKQQQLLLLLELASPDEKLLDKDQ